MNDNDKILNALDETKWVIYLAKIPKKEVNSYLSTAIKSKKLNKPEQFFF